MTNPNPTSQSGDTDASTQSTSPNGSASLNGTTSLNSHPATTEQHIWVVTGPAGCGKSTVGQYIATTMNYPFIEGDLYHTKDSVHKMATGIPLTDTDRWDWLITLRNTCITTLSKPSPLPNSTTSPNSPPSPKPQGVVLACSALKRKYRDVLRLAPYFVPNITLHFIYLKASEELLQARVKARTNHYMGPEMVHSQFEALEEPGADELGKDVFNVGVEGGVEVVEREVERCVRGVV